MTLRRTILLALGLTVVVGGAVCIIVWREKNFRKPVNLMLVGDLEALGRLIEADKAVLSVEHPIGKIQYWTILQIAVGNRNPEAVSLLLRHGADPNRKGKYSESALHIAVQQECSRCVVLLLEHGADVNAPGLLNRTPLFSAIGNAEMLRLLLAAGAKCDLRDQNGNTVLEFARRYGDAEATAAISNHCTAPR